jgi:hypothetical protein
MSKTRTGYSGKALYEKLGLRPGQRAWLVQAPADYFKWLELAPKDLQLAAKPGKEEPFIHVFLRSAKTLAADLSKASQPLAKDGALWASWRKGKLDGISDETVRAWALQGDLVDVKVCSVSEEWSGLKLVFRQEKR